VITRTHSKPDKGRAYARPFLPDERLTIKSQARNGGLDVGKQAVEKGYSKADVISDAGRNMEEAKV